MAGQSKVNANVRLFVEKRAAELADRARNQVLGVLTVFAVILSLIGALGGSALLRAYAEQEAKKIVEATPTPPRGYPCAARTGCR